MSTNRPAVAVGISIAALLLVLFVLLAAMVMATNGPLTIDHQIIALITPMRGSIAESPMKVATYLCSWQVVVAGVMIVVAGFAARHRWRLVVLVLVAVVGDEIIVASLKAIIRRPRPDQLLAIMPAAGSSFPSGHTFICIAFYGLLACLALRRARSSILRASIMVGIAAAVFAVGMSRIYLGAHWPTDVAGSCLLGSAWVALLLAVEQVIRPKANISA